MKIINVVKQVFEKFNTSRRYRSYSAPYSGDTYTDRTDEDNPNKEKKVSDHPDIDNYATYADLVGLCESINDVISYGLSDIKYEAGIDRFTQDGFSKMQEELRELRKENAYLKSEAFLINIIKRINECQLSKD